MNLIVNLFWKQILIPVILITLGHVCIANNLDSISKKALDFQQRGLLDSSLVISNVLKTESKKLRNPIYYVRSNLLATMNYIDKAMYHKAKNILDIYLPISPVIDVDNRFYYHLALAMYGVQTTNYQHIRNYIAAINLGNFSKNLDIAFQTAYLHIYLSSIYKSITNSYIFNTRLVPDNLKYPYMTMLYLSEMVDDFKKDKMLLIQTYLLYNKAKIEQHELKNLTNKLFDRGDVSLHPVTHIYGHYVQSKYYLEQKDTLSALETLIKGVDIRHFTQLILMQEFAIYNLANYYTETKNYKQALLLYQSINDEIIKANKKSFQVNKKIGNIYMNMGISDSAYYYISKYYNEVKSNNTLLFRNLNYEQQQKINFQLEDARSQSLYYRLWSYAAALAIVIIIIIFLAYNKQKEKKEKELEAINNQLNNQNIKLSQYSETIAYKLEKPFQEIQNILNQQTYADLNEELKDSISLIQNLNQEGINLIQQILSNFQHIHDSQSQKTEINLYQLIQNITQNKRKLETSCHLKITNHIDPNLQFWGIPMLIQELIVNIYNNAVKYRKSNDVHIEFNQVKTKKNYLHFVIKDYGQGIKSENLKNIFKSKFQENENENYGIGLHFCKQIVEEYHLGKIWAESMLGNYTEIHIMLPLRHRI